MIVGVTYPFWGEAMRHRIALWGLAGFLVAGCWAIVGFAIPLSTEPLLWNLARLSCPVVFAADALHSGISLYWVLIANIATYALLGLVFETMRRMLASHSALRPN